MLHYFRGLLTVQRHSATCVISRRDNHINLSSVQIARAIILGGFTVSRCLHVVSREMLRNLNYDNVGEFCASMESAMGVIMIKQKTFIIVGCISFLFLFTQKRSLIICAL